MPLFPRDSTAIPVTDKLHTSSRSHVAMRTLLPSVLAIPLLILGCKSAPAPGSSGQASSTPSAKVETFPPRPTMPPPPFKVFNHSQNSFTLTTKEDASDDEIEALVWQLRDATRGRTLDQLKISQKAFDADGSNVWFHIYRGTKCASEKYAAGPPPCGGSYHAAGDYSYSNYKNRIWDSGTLLHDENHEVRLWNPDVPYKSSTAK